MEYRPLCDAYRCLQLIENNAIQSSKVRARCMEVNDPHANSKCFFDLLHAKHLRGTITMLETDGLILRDSNSIAAMCTRYYQNLFASDYKIDDAWFSALQASLAFTPHALDSHMAATCEKCITEDEVFLAIQSLKNGKAPAMDGLTKEFVIEFWVSYPFPIERLVRQGCPLSPFFYAFASSPMFYLLEAKMNSSCIPGISHFDSLKWDGLKVEKGTIFRHLGYPLGINVSTKNKIDWVLRRIKGKMDMWHAAQWPLHTRIRIVQAFLQPYVMYYLLLLDWRKCHLHTFECLLKKFLWNKVHNQALVLSAWKYVCQPKLKGGLGILQLDSHLRARRVAFIMRVTSSQKPLWLDIFWQFMENARSCYKRCWKLDAWNKFFSHAPLQISRPTLDLLLRSFKMEASCLKWNGRQHWIFAKHTRWWKGAANIYYFSPLPDESIADQCNFRWKLRKSSAWWDGRFGIIWDSFFTFRTKIFMWRIYTRHFTLGAFLSKHGLERTQCPHCASYADNMRNTFWTCPHIHRWWNSLFIFPISDMKPTKFDCTFLLFPSDDYVMDWVRKTCVYFLLCNIWMLRNAKVFHNKVTLPYFSWTNMRLQVDAMPTRDRHAFLSLLDAL
ncbi:hypothetical protein KP509_22G057000 [Ceratopteris richardii]|uniref:Reverse transcriptase zinc-binding domain-containing protein n=1 Tax=Ceratopteris richardii TaxID=49495 RepID=A0A8T2S5H1_CERRI|nr:hypothetical protein KP509_22G057000 [Ceratopteris richardii]